LAGTIWNGLPLASSLSPATGTFTHRLITYLFTYSTHTLLMLPVSISVVI